MNPAITDKKSQPTALTGYGVITGMVKTIDGLPAAYVTIIIKENNHSTSTDDNGKFIFRQLKEGNYTLIISMVGLKPLQKTVEVKINQECAVTVVLEEEGTQLREVILENNSKRLNAGKMSIPDRDFPQSTGIVSAKTISEQQAIRLGEVVKNIPGVSLVQTRLGVNESYGARGYMIGVNGGAGGGSIFKNGLPANIAGMPEVATLESVEIIKGSTAFLYGSSSGGLIINLVTRKPTFNFGGELTMNAGSYSQYKPLVDLYGPLTKKLAYRLVGTYENDKSFREIVRTRRHYINPSLLYKFSKKTTLLLQADILLAHLIPDPGAGLLDSGRILTRAIPRSRFQNVSWAYNDVRHNSISALLKCKIKEQFSFTASAAYQNTDVGSYGVGNLNTASKTGIIARPLSRAHSLEKDFALQANLEGKILLFKKANHFLVGSDLTSIVTTTDAFAIYNPNGTLLKSYDTINLLDPRQYSQRNDVPSAGKIAATKAPSLRAGLYLQDLITLDKHFKIFAGLRYSYQATVRTRIDSIATATITPGATPTTSYNVLSSKAGIVYQPASAVSLYASYSNNFTTNTGVDVNGDLLPASVIDQFELGAKSNLAGGKLAATVSVYRIINSHLAQQATYLADGITPNTNSNIKTLSGETTSDGIEFGLNGNLSKNLYFITGYSQNYIRFTNSAGGKGANIEGERLVNAPLNTGNASIFYTFSNELLNGLKIGATGFYTGSRWGGYNNTVGQAVSGSRLIALTGFTTLNLFAAYGYKKFMLQCKLSNLFNTLNYLVHDNYSVSPVAPRELMTTVSYKF